MKIKFLTNTVYFCRVLVQWNLMLPLKWWWVYHFNIQDKLKFDLFDWLLWWWRRVLFIWWLLTIVVRYKKIFSVVCSVSVSGRVCWEWEQNNLIELAQSFANKLMQEGLLCRLLHCSLNTFSVILSFSKIPE